jgi:hypothetical protein
MRLPDTSQARIGSISAAAQEQHGVQQQQETDHSAET